MAYGECSNDLSEPLEAAVKRAQAHRWAHETAVIPLGSIYNGPQIDSGMVSKTFFGGDLLFSIYSWGLCNLLAESTTVGTFPA